MQMIYASREKCVVGLCMLGILYLVKSRKALLIKLGVEKYFTGNNKTSIFIYG